MYGLWRNFCVSEARRRKQRRSRNAWLPPGNDRGERIVGRVDGDPMVGKDQIGLRGNGRHVALRAGLCSDVRLVTLSRVAFAAGGIVSRQSFLERRVGGGA